MRITRLCALLSFAGQATAQGQRLHAVPLLLKPAEPTGRITLAAEGLDVLRQQRGPFGIVTAVGPTRTGKSTILGRAFLRGAHENLFEIGAGVTSFTGGVWISSRPIVLGGLRVLLVDTEGFAGVGGLTSRTYEANLFGLVYLLSSAVIFNTAFPVDASTTAMMSAHAAHALRMLQELHARGAWLRRRPPALVWAVQGARAPPQTRPTSRAQQQQQQHAPRSLRARTRLHWSALTPPSAPCRLPPPSRAQASTCTTCATVSYTHLTLPTICSV